ncbi:hypothetical protein FACS1894200_08170 [Spirochaetia bacterium]|nr:hypothetical protein FACS1894200_08170 [Spirochaetia bacterium]
MKIFNYAENKIRTVQIEDETWFVAKDVCDILEYANASKAILDHVEPEDKLNNESLVSLGQRGGWLINESGLYSLVLKSKMPEAKAFKRWVIHEVLPAIRKTGSYSVYTPKTYIEALKALIVIEEEKEALKIALNESLEYYTVAKYNREKGMGWNLEECKQVGKQLTAHCKARNIEMRKCLTNDERFGSVNSYPLTVWKDFYGDHNAV